ncbi:uncharacterized protein BDV17DRAFT_268557 [Aspergillus undulatus]|uniref:uncharacterized protein n=1 Tax=Aspergillus undulatus TaxID=1810928 RepID=UPI003CCD7288
MILPKYLIGLVLFMALSVEGLPARAQELSTRPVPEIKPPSTSLSQSSETKESGIGLQTVMSTPAPSTRALAVNTADDQSYALPSGLSPEINKLSPRATHQKREFSRAGIVFVPVIVFVICIGSALCCAAVGRRRGGADQQQQQQQQQQQGITLHNTVNVDVDVEARVQSPIREPPRVILRDVNGVTVVEMVGQGQDGGGEGPPPPYSVVRPR